MTQVYDRDMDNHINQIMQGWAGEGTLSPDKSGQLEDLVCQLSGKNQRGRLTSVVRGVLAALAAYITMLFFACPAAGSVISAVRF